MTTLIISWAVQQPWNLNLDRSVLYVHLENFREGHLTQFSDNVLVQVLIQGIRKVRAIF